jgi:hypothetical protein
MWVLWAAQLRGKSAESFVKFSAACVPIAAGLALWVATAVDVGDDVDGYPLDPSYMGEARGAMVLLLALSLPYVALTIRGIRTWSLALGGLCSLAGMATLVFLAQVVSIPTWGYGLTLLSMIAGALVLGAASLGMVLGHWYLVTPRLPEQPLREMTFWLMVALGVQAALIVLALLLPRDEVSTAVDTPILENPFFWMRVGGGLVFPAVLAWMAYDSSGMRAMQSATGLLYIAMALVLSGEVVGKGLLFVSAVPN